MVKQGLDASHRLIRVIVWSQQRYCWQGGGMRPPVLAERVSMEHSDQPEQASEAVAPVNDIFDAVELASAVNVSKSLRGEHRIVYANKAFEVLTGRELGEIRGRGWSILDAFRNEDDPQV